MTAEIKVCSNKLKKANEDFLQLQKQYQNCQNGQQIKTVKPKEGKNIEEMNKVNPEVEKNKKEIEA